MDVELVGRMKAEAVRGASLLLTGEVDLVEVAFRALEKKFKSGGREVFSPVEAAVLACFLVSLTQFEQMMEELGLAEISDENRATVMRTLIRERLEKFLMLSLEEASD